MHLPFLLPMVITCHLSLLNSICHDSDHSDIFFWRSCWSIFTSDSDFIVRKIFVSSANFKTELETSSSRSFIYTRNQIGSKTDPWGTSLLTGSHEDCCTLTTTLCFLQTRQFLIHCCMRQIFNAYSLLSNLRCGTLSEALLKSR